MYTAQELQEKPDVNKVRTHVDGEERWDATAWGRRKGGSFGGFLGVFVRTHGVFFRCAGRGGGREHDGARRGGGEGGAHRAGPNPPPRPGTQAPAVTVIARAGEGSILLPWVGSSSARVSHEEQDSYGCRVLLLIL